MNLLPKKILLFAAHHDDETISCAGTIKKMSLKGVEVVVVFATNGATGIDHTKKYEQDIKNQRILESKKVGELLGIKEIINWSQECQNFKNSKENLHKAIKIIRKERPCIVITHSFHEKHRDHKNLSKLIEEAVWKASEDIMPNLGQCYRVKDTWAFEVVNLLDRVDFCIDITEYMDYKIKAMQIYESQKNVVSGVIDYIDGIGKVRGFEIGVKYAEAFKRLGSQPVECY